MKPVKSWIVIADGARARIFANDGPGKGLIPLPAETAEHSHKPSREIDADRPGRTHDRLGPGRHAMEPPSDAHRTEKRRFAEALAARLNSKGQAGSYDRLILVAPAKTLGDLRSTLSKETLAKVSGELPKDLTHIAEQELPAHLGKVIAL